MFITSYILVTKPLLFVSPSPIRPRSLVVNDLRSESKGSRFESGVSREELKRFPPPSPSVLWIVNVRERKPIKKKREKKKTLLSLTFYQNKNIISLTTKFLSAEVPDTSLRSIVKSRPRREFASDTMLIRPLSCCILTNTYHKIKISDANVNKGLNR